jgi:hypothetical protein
MWKAAIDNREIPVWKLSYKKLPDPPIPGSVLDYLLSLPTQQASDECKGIVVD